MKKEYMMKKAILTLALSLGLTSNALAKEISLSEEPVIESTIDNEENNEELLQNFLNQYGISYENFSVIANRIMLEAEKCGRPYEDIYEMIRDFNTLREIPKEEKLEVVLPYFNINESDLDFVQAVATYESDDNSGINYFSGYLLANHFCARLNSRTWVSTYGNNIIGQLTARGQYSVVTENLYVGALGKWSAVSDAVLDRFFLEATGEFPLFFTDYLGFRAAGAKGEVFLPRDNAYRSELTDADRMRERPAPVVLEDSELTLSLIKEE